MASAFYDFHAEKIFLFLFSSGYDILRAVHHFSDRHFERGKLRVKCPCYLKPVKAGYRDIPGNGNPRSVQLGKSESRYNVAPVAQCGNFLFPSLM